MRPFRLRARYGAEARQFLGPGHAYAAKKHGGEMPVILSGQMDLSSAMEDVALAGNTDIASFTVDNTTDAAGDFTATIDWGDGTTSAGTIVGSNGSFTVEGGHTYLDE